MTLVLTRGDVAALLTLDECIAAVEEAFALQVRSSAGFADATRSGGRLGGGPLLRLQKGPPPIVTVPAACRGPRAPAR